MTSPASFQPAASLPSNNRSQALVARSRSWLFAHARPKPKIASDDGVATVITSAEGAPSSPLGALLLHRDSQTLIHRRKLEQRLPRGLMPPTDSDMFAMVERGARRRQIALAGDSAPESFDLGAWSAFVETTLSPRGDRCLLGHRDRPLALLTWSQGRVSLVPVPGIWRLSVSPPPVAVYTPDGEHLLAVAGNDARGQTHLWRSGGRAKEPDRATLGPSRVLALSAAGNLVATQSTDPSNGRRLRVWLFGDSLAPPRWFERSIERSIDRAHFTSNGRSLFFSHARESHLVDIEFSLPTRIIFDGPFWGLREDGENLLNLAGPTADNALPKLTHVRRGHIDSEREVDVERSVRFDPPQAALRASFGDRNSGRHMMMTAREPAAAQLIVLEEQGWRLRDATHLQTITESPYDSSLALSRAGLNLVGAVGTWDTLLLSSARGVAVSCIRSGVTQALLCPPVLGAPQAIAWEFEGAGVALFAHDLRPMLHLWSFEESEREPSGRWPSIIGSIRRRGARGNSPLRLSRTGIASMNSSRTSTVWGAWPLR